MNISYIERFEYGNWNLYGDCVNITNELTSEDVTNISRIEKIRVIQPWKYMPSEKTWLELNEKVFVYKPDTKLHIWADTIQSDFIFLSKMSNVRHLDLNQVKFKDKETLGNLIGLKSLTLINGNVLDLHFLNRLENIEELEIGRIRGLNDLSFISNLNKLKSLDINNQAQVEQLPNFEKNRELKVVKLFTLKSLHNISNLKDLTNLEELYFYGLNKEIEPEHFFFLKACKKIKLVSANFNTKMKQQRFDTFKESLLNKDGFIITCE